VIVLSFYTRVGCHLCEQMLADLAPLVEGRARIEIVDIETDAALTLRFGQIVPVLMHGDDELSRIRLDPGRVDELLDRSS
jgi:thioredoxin reductase (NADPH)